MIWPCLAISSRETKESKSGDIPGESLADTLTPTPYILIVSHAVNIVIDIT
jgi:hypothetical protein